MPGGVPDRSQLSLPLQRASTSYDGAVTGERKAQPPKLMKSYSTPPDYSAYASLNAGLGSSSSSHSSGELRGRPRLSRAQSIRDTISSSTAKFFGVPPSDVHQSPVIGAAVDPKWSSRRMRYICKRYGNLREDALAKELGQQVPDDLSDMTSPSKSITPQEEIRGTFAITPQAVVETFPRTTSVDSRANRLISAAHPCLERRESVIKMAYDRISAIVQSGTFRPKKCGAVKRGRSTSSSFSPFSIQQTGNVTHVKVAPPVVGTAVAGEHEPKEKPATATTPPKRMPARFPSFAMIGRQKSMIEKPMSFFPKSMSTVTEADDEGSRDESKLEIPEDDELKEEDEGSEAAELKKSRPAIRFQPDVIIQPRSKRPDEMHEMPQVSLVKTDHLSLKQKGSLPLSVALSMTSTESLQDEVFFDVAVTPPTVSTLSTSGVSDMEQGEQALSSRTRSFGYRKVPYKGERNGEFASTSFGADDYRHGDRLKDRLKETGSRPHGPGAMDRPKLPEMQLQMAAEQVRHRISCRRLGQLHRQESFDAGMKTPMGLFDDGNDNDEKTTRLGTWRSVLSSQKEWLLQNIHNEKRTKEYGETTKLWRKRSFLDMVQEKLRSRKYSVPHRRRFGLGFGIWRKYVHRNYKKDAYQSNIDAYVDYRPFFTYWVTTVQILVTLISLYTYGIGPWGFGRSERTADVLHATVTLKRVSIYVQQNIWLGPKFADLVHLGAKFTPCMRRDPRIYAQIEADRREENETGCCIYNDGTGCFQTGQRTCPSLIATLARWKESSPGPNGRISGSVCGQDPRYCEDPVSVKPYEWPDDITEWPMCKLTTLFIPENEKHMQCEITGRPCCIQLHGQCRITTRDYCDFVEGYFHENATLCSQVSCLSEVCGMLPFLRRNQPDQWYRLFIPLFLHAGIFHCVLTVVIQILYMRDLEKLLGWARIAVLYMVSGIGGYLAGAIFVPYKPEVGPAGSHIGMFAAMYVDVVYSWNLLERPWHAVMQLSLFTLLLFAIGTLPWVDNWAHLFGFIFGFLISLAVLPYIQTKRHNRAQRILIVIASLSAAVGLFIVLLALFYWLPGFDCPYCEYFNCIPYTDHFCDNQGLRLKTWLPI